MHGFFILMLMLKFLFFIRKLKMYLKCSVAEWIKIGILQKRKYCQYGIIFKFKWLYHLKYNSRKTKF